MRFNLLPWTPGMFDAYGFFEWSRPAANVSTVKADRVFTGMVVRY